MVPKEDLVSFQGCMLGGFSMFYPWKKLFDIYPPGKEHMFC